MSERVRERSRGTMCKGMGVPLSPGWSGGAMVLGKFPVPGCPTYLDYSKARAYCTCSRCGWGCLEICLSSIISHLLLPLFGRQI